MLALRIVIEQRNMPVSKLLSVAQVSARLQCACSTVRKLIADGELRASRISSRTIRISETDLQAYLDGRANVSAPAVASARTREAAQCRTIS
jgi:excisionase family DNA binding protein